MVLINHSKKSFLNILIIIAENKIPNKTDHRMNISGNIPILTKKIPINIKDEQKITVLLTVICLVIPVRYKNSYVDVININRRIPVSE